MNIFIIKSKCATLEMVINVGRGRLAQRFE